MVLRELIDRLTSEEQRNGGSLHVEVLDEAGYWNPVGKVIYEKNFATGEQLIKLVPKRIEDEERN